MIRLVYTAFKLGIINIFRVIVYRALIYLHLMKYICPVKSNKNQKNISALFNYLPSSSKKFRQVYPFDKEKVIKIVNCLLKNKLNSLSPDGCFSSSHSDCFSSSPRACFSSSSPRGLTAGSNLRFRNLNEIPHQEVRDDMVMSSRNSRSEYPGSISTHLSSEKQGANLFSDHVQNIDSSLWFYNPYNKYEYKNVAKHWSQIKDFSEDFQDIKIYWDISRFGWVLNLVEAYLITSDKQYIDILNKLCIDWILKNPVNAGINWKCAQEVSIRALHMFLAMYLLEQYNNPREEIISFFVQHCERISPTMFYALAQNNNHILSESIALFIIGSWLLSLKTTTKSIKRNAKKWQKKGLYLLEKKVNDLILNDGGFSQYSLNYHRMALSLLTFVEIFREKLDLPAFSSNFYSKCIKTTTWLNMFVDDKSGHAPNTGENDGTLLFPFGCLDYVDYRSIIQLSSFLFLGKKAYNEPGLYDTLIYWFLPKPINHKNYAFSDETLQTNLAHSSLKEQINIFNDSGFIAYLLKSENNVLNDKKNLKFKPPNSHTKDIDKTMIPISTWGILRYPKFKFRPHHADILHFDLWHNGVNILRDGGTYSYADLDAREYFSSSLSHNTIQFDDRNQMPRISRFLYAEWPKLLFEPQINYYNNNDKVEIDKESKIEGNVNNEINKNNLISDNISVCVAYKDYKGAIHKRTIKTEIDKDNKKIKWFIIDEVSNFKSKAVLRWRLVPSNWAIIDNNCVSDLAKIKVFSSVEIVRIELVDGWESLNYLEKSKIPVLEVEINGQKGDFITEVEI